MKEDLYVGTITAEQAARYCSKEDFLSLVKEWMAGATPPITAAELARKIGVQPQHLSKWMQGKVNPSTESRLRIIDGLRALEEEES